jgi:hypothetical protein
MKKCKKSRDEGGLPAAGIHSWRNLLLRLKLEVAVLFGRLFCDAFEPLVSKEESAGIK